MSSARPNEPLPSVPLVRDSGTIMPISLTGERLPILRPGDQVMIKVLNMLGEGRALINVRGVNLVAEGLADMPLGTQLAATVKEVHPRPVLQLANAVAGSAAGQAEQASQTQPRTVFLQEQPAAAPQSGGAQGGQTVELSASQAGAAKTAGGQMVELVLPDGRTMAGRIDTDIMPGVKAGERFAAVVQEAGPGKVVILARGQTLVLESPAQTPAAGWAGPGQVLGATVARTGGNLSIVLEQPAEPNQLFAGMRAGGQFKATVVDRLADGGALMHGRGGFFEADLPADIRPGTRLTLAVGAERGQQFLQIVHQGPATDNQSVRQLETQVAQFLRQTALPEYSPAQSMQQMRQELATLLAGQPGAGHPIAGQTGAGQPVAGELAAGQLVGGQPNAVQLPPELAQAANALRERLDQMIGQDPVIKSDNIRQIVRDGGVFYETRLYQATQAGPGEMAAAARNDLKGLLLGLSDALASAGSQAGQSLAGPTAGALANVESQQMMNALSQARGGPVWIEVPLGSAMPWTAVGMLIEQEKLWAGRDQDYTGRDAYSRDSGQGASKPGHSILFLLNMEQLGRIRVDARVKEKNVQATIYVENDPAQESFSRSLTELAGALDARGYPNAALAVRNKIHTPPDKDRKFNNLQRGWTASTSVIDVRV
ncbi:MAG: flagellar hook-length control protein FliK [Planctomycetes bacterium]|nr:flagellar hook-length control protein FliK [Planctomycetota bacterium]